MKMILGFINKIILTEIDQIEILIIVREIQIEEIIIKMILLKPTNLTLVNLMGLELQILYPQSVIQLI